VNLKIHDLHQALLFPQNEKERIDVIWQKIEENPFNFYEYMENYPPPHADFLQIIVGL
jgi:hypothetical protein